MATKKQSKAKQIMPRIKDLPVGESVSFPIEWMDTVRCQTSKCNVLYGGLRSTRMDKEDRVIIVERKS